MADHNDRLRVTQPREQPLEIAGHGVEVVAIVGPVALAVSGQVDRDDAVGWDEPVGHQVPPARVAREAVEGKDRRLATGVVADGQPEAGRVDTVFGDVMGHVTGLWPVRASTGPAR